jgi:UDP-GlcNAc:undecaprenyl-phosphate GlcNAc-1-phosphate transferase
VAVINLSIPLMVLALPLFDMTLAIVRRALRGQPIFAPDGDHIHHRMLARGLPHARVVVLLWLSTALFAGLAYLNVIGVGGWWTLTGAVLAMWSSRWCSGTTSCCAACRRSPATACSGCATSGAR